MDSIGAHSPPSYKPTKKKRGSCLKRGGAVTLENNKMVTVVYMKDTFFLPDNPSPPA
jgi:hypothetical protein